jgi:hypothetical protein
MLSQLDIPRVVTATTCGWTGRLVIPLSQVARSGPLEGSVGIVLPLEVAEDSQ